MKMLLLLMLQTVPVFAGSSGPHVLPNSPPTTEQKFLEGYAETHRPPAALEGPLGSLDKAIETAPVAKRKEKQPFVYVNPGQSTFEAWADHLESCLEAEAANPNRETLSRYVEGFGEAAKKEKDANYPNLDTYLTDLGAATYTTRRHAVAMLSVLGEAAREKVKEKTSSVDPEVAERAREILRIQGFENEETLALCLEVATNYTATYWSQFTEDQSKDLYCVPPKEGN